MLAARVLLVALTSASLVLGGTTPAAWAAGKAAPVPAPKVAPTAPPLGVKIGQAKDLTHIEFGSDPVSAKKDGADVVLRFARGPSPDLSRLKITPPHFVKAALVTPVAGGVELRVTPADGAGFRLGKADGVSFLSLFPLTTATPEPSAAPVPAPKDQAPAARADPVPANGVVKMQPDLAGGAMALRFPWRAPLGAAVFRRGDAIWIVFDAKANLDLSAAPRGRPQLQKMQAVQGGDYSAVRIVAPPTVMASATATGGTWTVTLGSSMTPPTGVPLSRDDASGPATLTAQVAGSTGVFWLADPVVGDKLAVVTALAPAKGLDQRHAFIDATLLASWHGLAIEPAAEDLSVVTDGDTVRIGRPRGLALSPTTAKARAMTTAQTLDLPAASSLPALIDYAAWSKTGEGGFVRRYQQLEDAAADEAGKGKAGGVSARLGLARFLVGSQLSFEAIGVLNLLAKTNPAMMGDAEFRGLRGAARAMAGRYKDAQADFSSPALAEDPASGLWRGYVSAKLGDWSGAREQFSRGRSVMPLFTPEWRSRFARMSAEAALASGDLGTARNELILAGNGDLSLEDRQAVELTQAKLSEAENNPGQALGLYDLVAKSDYGALAAPAVLHATQLRLGKGELKPGEAVSALNALRYRWRGDSTEFEAVRALGHIYLQQGQWREALEALRSAGQQRSADQPASLAVAADMSAAFRALFLDGQADGMQPIQALALFYDFKDLTPIGADGDLMVRKMVKRLVSVDLLTQASELLKYQVDQRLNGVAKAQVATDLAVVDLMDKRPEDALGALNDSRTTLLPTALNAQRRIVEARALMGLGRGDHALEILQGDKSAEAADIRAEAEWKQRAWPQAGNLLEVQLGDRWKSPQPLSADEQGRLMRASIAYSLAGDDAALGRLRTRYAKLAEGSSAPDALRVALAGVSDGALTAQDFAKASSDAAAFTGWVAAMKTRFTNQPTWLTGPTAAPAQAVTPAKPAAKTPAKAPLRQAQAAPAKPGAKKG